MSKKKPVFAAGTVVSIHVPDQAEPIIGAVISHTGLRVWIWELMDDGTARRQMVSAEGGRVAELPGYSGLSGVCVVLAEQGRLRAPMLAHCVEAEDLCRVAAADWENVAKFAEDGPPGHDEGHCYISNVWDSLPYERMSILARAYMRHQIASGEGWFGSRYFFQRARSPWMLRLMADLYGVASRDERSQVHLNREEAACCFRRAPDLFVAWQMLGLHFKEWGDPSDGGEGEGYAEFMGDNPSYRIPLDELLSLFRYLAETGKPAFDCLVTGGRRQVLSPEAVHKDCEREVLALLRAAREAIVELSEADPADSVEGRAYAALQALTPPLRKRLDRAIAGGASGPA